MPLSDQAYEQKHKCHLHQQFSDLEIIFVNITSSARLIHACQFMIPLASKQAKRLLYSFVSRKVHHSSSSTSMLSPFACPFAADLSLGAEASLLIICLDTETMLSSISCCPTSSKCFFGSTF